MRTRDGTKAMTNPTTNITERGITYTRFETVYGGAKCNENAMKLCNLTGSAGAIPNNQE